MDGDKDNKAAAGEFLCEAKNIIECRSEAVRPAGRSGPLIAMLPVLVSQTRIHADIESKIRLPKPALDICRCQRDVYITQCRLFNTGNATYGKIFTDGYLDERIEYVEAYNTDHPDTRGLLRFFTARIPFQCAARIEYSTPPVLKSKHGFLPVEIFSPGAGCLDPQNASEALHLRVGHHEKLLFEPMDVMLQEISRVKGRRASGVITGREESFDEFTEQLSIAITFALMQKQMIFIPRY